MQYISRSEAKEKYQISLVTLDKYLKLWRIYRTRRKWQYYIDAVALDEYMRMKNAIWGPFENKTLFEDDKVEQSGIVWNSWKQKEFEQIWAEKKPQNATKEEKKDHQEQKTELAMIAWFQWIIQSKDDLLEQKNNKILEQEKTIRSWSNWFFVMFVLFVCSVLFLLYILQ